MPCPWLLQGLLHILHLCAECPVVRLFNQWEVFCVWRKGDSDVHLPSPPITVHLAFTEKNAKLFMNGGGVQQVTHSDQCTAVRATSLSSATRVKERYVTNTAAATDGAHIIRDNLFFTMQMPKIIFCHASTLKNKIWYIPMICYHLLCWPIIRFEHTKKIFKLQNRDSFWHNSRYSYKIS